MARGCWPSGTDIPTIPVELFAKFLNNTTVEDFSEGYDDHEMVVTVDHQFIVGFYTPDQTWFVQKIVSIPGTRLDPPDEDYKDLITTKLFTDAMRELAKGFANLALDLVGDAAMEERDEDASVRFASL